MVATIFTGNFIYMKQTQIKTLLGGGVKVALFTFILVACKKQSESSSAEIESASSQAVGMKVPSLENGILKFSDFRSFRFYGSSKSPQQPISAGGARTNRGVYLNEKRI